MEPTASAKVLRAIASPPPRDVRERVERILALATGDRERELGAAILNYARMSEGVGMTTEPVPCDESDDGEDERDLLAKGLAALGGHRMAAEAPGSYTSEPAAPEPVGDAR